MAIPAVAPVERGAGAGPGVGVFEKVEEVEGCREEGVEVLVDKGTTCIIPVSMKTSRKI